MTDEEKKVVPVWLMTPERDKTWKEIVKRCEEEHSSPVNLEYMVEVIHDYLEIRAILAADAELTRLRAEVKQYKERLKLETIRYEGISSANEELRAIVGRCED